MSPLTKNDDLKQIISKLSLNNLRSSSPSSADLKKKAKELENDLTQTNIDLNQTNIRLKNGICCWVKYVVSIYLIFIGIVVASIAYNKGLSDTVLIALLTTTTINILGLPLMIILSLFPNIKK